MPIVVAQATSGRLTPTAATTVCAMANNVLGLVEDHGYINHLSGSHSSSTTTFTLTRAGTFEEGDELEFRADCSMERVRVTTGGTDVSSITVARGVRGTTAASHATGAEFVKNPDYMGLNAQNAVNAALQNDLWPELYAVYQATYTPTSPHNPYLEAASDAMRLVRVYQRSDSSSPTTLLECEPFDPDPHLSDTTTSSTARYWYVPNLADADNTVYAQYLITPAVGDLTAGMARVVEYGAARRLILGEDAQGSQHDSVDQSGTAAPGGFARSASSYVRLQRDAIVRERLALRAYARKPGTYRRNRHY